jgi:hypothetical protein
MLSDIILIGNNKAGSFALADTKQSMLAAALQAQLENIADVFNSKAVPQLFRYNNCADMSRLPKIVPGRIQTPNMKELALVLRSMGLKIAGDIEMQNFLRHILGAPELTTKVFEEVYKPQGTMKQLLNPNGGQEKAEPKDGQPKSNPDDTVDNDFEQSDEAYTGGK